MKKLIYILPAVMAVCSCEYEFEIEGQLSASQTYLRFVPSNESDTTFLFVQATTPLKDGNHPSVTEGESIRVQVNGNTIELKKQADPEGVISSKVYATTHKFHPGDKIELEADVPGRKTATASVVVPQEFPQPKWSYEIEKNPQRYSRLHFEIEYENAPESSGRYAVAVLEERTYQSETWSVDDVTGEYGWKVHEPEVSIGSCASYVTFDSKLSSLGRPLTFRPAMLNWDNRKYPHGDGWYSSPDFVQAIAWTDMPEKTARRGSHQIYVWCHFDGVEESYYDETYAVRTAKSYRYKLVFYSFDEASYCYQKAHESLGAPDFASLGLAPSSMTYTNIRDGIGVCGAYIVSETDWFKIKE